MKLCREITSLEDFEAWSGGKYMYDEILNAGLGDEFIAMLEELYPDGMTDTQLNDILWFESDWIRENLCLTDIDEDDEE